MTARAVAGVVCLVVLGCGAASCSTQDNASTPRATSSPSSSAARPSAAVCADLASLRSSVKRLATSARDQGGLSGLADELASVQATLKRIPSDASAQYASQVDAVKAAGHALDRSIQSAKDAPSSSTMAAVGADVVALGTAVTTLADAVANTC